MEIISSKEIFVRAANNINDKAFDAFIDYINVMLPIIKAQRNKPALKVIPLWVALDNFRANNALKNLFEKTK